MPVLIGLAVLALVGKMAISALPVFAPDVESVRKDAVAHLQKGKPRAARAALVEALQARPDWAEGHVLLARASVQSDDGVSALTALKQAAAHGAKADTTNAIAGHAHWLNGDLAAAEKSLLAPIAKPELGYANRILGRVYLDMNSPNEARVALDNAAKFTPKSAELWTDIATFRWRLTDLIGAIDAADRALAFDANHVPALILRGDMAREQLGPVPAIAFYERALKQTPESMPVLSRLAEAQGAAGRNADLLQSTRAMLKHKPKSGQAFYLQAVMAARAGKNDLARVLLEKADAEMKDVPAYLLTSAVVEYRLDNYNRCVDRLERLARMQPNNLKVQRMLARALYQIGDAEGALERIKPLADRSDGDAYARMLTGRALEALDERDDATPYLESASMVEASEGEVLPGRRVDPRAGGGGGGGPRQCACGYPLSARVGGGWTGGGGVAPCGGAP